MNKIPAHILDLAIKESLTDYESKEIRNSLGGLYLYHDIEDNVLVIYDDSDHVLNKVQLPDEQTFNLVHTLRQVLQQAWRERLFEKDYIVKPFTVSLIDKDFVVLDELFFLDNNTLKSNDLSWKNIEKDLDDFIKNLLK